MNRKWLSNQFVPPARRARQRAFGAPLRFELLEDRVAPAVYTALINPATNNAGAVAELVGIFSKASTDGEADTINLFPFGQYTFTAAADSNEGSNALPSIVQDGIGKNTVTVNGNGATFFRDVANPAAFRFLRVSGNPN